MCVSVCIERRRKTAGDFSFLLSTGRQLLILLAAGISAAGGQFLLTASYKHAPAGEISIYQYSQIVFASLMGLIFLAEVPDLLSLAGYLLIFAGGFIIYKKS